MSARSSKTTRVGLDGVQRTVFSRAERVMINPDGSRKTQVRLLLKAAGYTGTEREL